MLLLQMFWGLINYRNLPILMSSFPLTGILLLLEVLMISSGEDRLIFFFFLENFISDDGHLFSLFKSHFVASMISFESSRIICPSNYHNKFFSDVPFLWCIIKAHS